MSVTRVPETKCLVCGVKLNAIGDLDDGTPDRGPKPGEAVACIRCGAVATVDEGGALRPFTDDEARELEADAEAMADLAGLVRRIQIVRAMRN
jgi:hypothetical protein